MDELDRQILRLMMKNARMPVKDIAHQVNLTSPAVSSRIHRLESDGIISGYTAVLHPPEEESRVQALISIAVDSTKREEFNSMVEHEPEVLQCYRVTGTYSFILKVSCVGVDGLERLLSHIQKLGSTNTQVILATQVDRPLMY